MKTFALLALCAATSLAQYKAEPSGPPPPDLDPAIAGAIAKEGMKVVGGDGKVVCEIWLVTAVANGAPPDTENSTFTTIPQGALVGAIRFENGGSDRRGQTVKAGTYSLRYSQFPINGDHQGVAPQRDFFLLTPAGDDKDPKATPNFDTLVGWSKKASGTPHPAVLSVWKQEPGDFKAGLSQLGEHDWVLQMKAGDQLIAIIVVGKAEG